MPQSTLGYLGFKAGQWAGYKAGRYLYGLTGSGRRKARRFAHMPRRLPYRIGRRFRKGFSRTGGMYKYAAGVNKGKEKKFFDVSVGPAVIASTGTMLLTSMNLIAAGSGESERIGRKMHVHKIMLRYHCFMAEQTSFVNNHDTLKFYLYLDTQANGMAATVAEILDVVNGALSFRNLGNGERFKILATKTVNIFATAGGGDGTTVDIAMKSTAGAVYRNVSIPLEFSAAVGALTELRSNNIGLMAISLHGLLALTFNCRLRFTG